jgi:hypothetical protein
MLALAFSRDRAFQLDALLSSVAKHLELTDVTVLYRATDPKDRKQYETVREEHPEATLVPEQVFDIQVKRLLSRGEKHVLFLTDDTLFFRPVNLRLATRHLMVYPEVLGMSLRLGNNTTYCYPAARDQHPPYAVTIDGWLQYRWQDAEGDFAYPFDLSASMYRTADVLRYWPETAPQNPNELENGLHQNRRQVSKQWFACLQRSAAVSTPWNQVAVGFEDNRTSNRADLSVEALRSAFENGRRLHLESTLGNSGPIRASHQVLEPWFYVPVKKEAV